MSNLIPVSDIEKMALAISKSGLFGLKTPEQALALMLIAQAEGCHPAIAARDYHIIQGRPALKADAMLARFQAAGGKVKFVKLDDTEVSAEFSHPSGGSVTIGWTFEQAKRAGLTNKDVWKQYPRQMLRSRVISEGIRTVFPGVAVGVYTPEEVEEFDAKPPTKDVKAEAVTGPKAPVHSAAEPIQPEIMQDPAAIRTSLYAKIAKGNWSKAQLAEYAQGKGKADANQFTVEELQELLSLCTSMPYAEFKAQFSLS